MEVPWLAQRKEDKICILIIIDRVRITILPCKLIICGPNPMNKPICGLTHSAIMIPH